jgi:hypothetical protein
MSDLIINILAEIIAAVLIAIFVLLIAFPFRLPFIYRKRRKLFQFFGVSKQNHKFIVYLSSVYVLREGSVDFRGVQRTFEGPAVPAAELSVIEPLVRLFANPFLDGLSPKIRSWLGNRIHWTFSQITPIVMASPKDKGQVESGNILTVGSQYYNSAGDLYTESCDPILKFEQVNERMVIKVKKGSREGDIFEQRPERFDDLAIVEKLLDSATNSTVFIAAGLGVVGTVGSVHYLINNWCYQLR